MVLAQRGKDQGKRPCEGGTAPTEEKLVYRRPVEGGLAPTEECPVCRGPCEGGLAPTEEPVYMSDLCTKDPKREGEPVTPNLCTRHGTLIGTFEWGYTHTGNPAQATCTVVRS